MTTEPKSTVTFDEWLDYAKGIKQDTTTVFHYDAMKYLSTSPSIVAFMTTPVAIHDGKTIEAKTRKGTDLKEIKELFNDSKNQIFPYQLLYQPSQVGFGYIDIATGKLVDIVDEDGNPSYTEMPSFWLVRYAEVEII